MGCKRTILECAVASRLTMDLAFPVLFSRLLSKNVASRSFLENGPKHAHLVRDLELSYTDFAKEGGRLGLVSSLAIFKELRSLVLRLAEPDSPPLGLVSKMKLTRLELCSSAELIPLDVIPPSVKYLAIEGCAPPDPSRTLEALDAAAGNLKTLELRVTGDHIRAFLESIPSYPRVVSAIKKLRLKGSDLQHADVLFQNPLFRPAALSIFSSTERRGRPVRLPPTLGALRGLEELELVYGKTDFLLRVSLLPQATVLVIDNYRSALAKEQSEALESALRRDYGSVYVRHIEQVRGTTCRHDAAEREMWRRLTAGKKLTVFESRSSGYIILTRDL
ncbi:hypothetical protein DFJ74DRAFT_644674 [Hyaloraphidium curvatum]|nr:hypothetical protein DFJ74DRAFT_644674 [Hyaloraphidium curvatum]